MRTGTLTSAFRPDLLPAEPDAQDDLMPYWLTVNVSALGVEQISNP